MTEVRQLNWNLSILLQIMCSFSFLATYDVSSACVVWLSCHFAAQISLWINGDTLIGFWGALHFFFLLLLCPKVLFADDTSLFMLHKNPLAPQKIINRELVKVNTWFTIATNITKKNCIVFHSNKHLMNNNDHVCLQINGMILNE